MLGVSSLHLLLNGLTLGIQKTLKADLGGCHVLWSPVPVPRRGTVRGRGR